MVFQNTQSTRGSTFEEQGWVFSPMNIPVVVVDPPLAVQVRDIESAYTGLAGDLHLIEPERELGIDEQVHLELLDRSVTEYHGIWKTLADK